MLKGTSTTTSIQFGIFIVLLAASFIMPRIAVGDEMGLAAAGIGAITFLFFAALALIVAIFTLVTTLMGRTQLPRPMFYLGLSPIPLMIVAALILVVVAQIRN